MKNWRAVGDSKDFWSGIIFFVVGACFVGLGRGYPMGTTMRMGPGYFPTVLGGLLALIGLALMVRTMFQSGASLGRLAYGKVALITAANVLFALLLRRMGLALALVLLVMVSAYASQRFRWRAGLVLAAGLTVGSTIIFLWLLKLPIPLFGTWLGG